MRMLRFLRLAVLVVCIAAFASGCGGGGGGGSATTPVMECPQGQVGTYPDCMDPPPTDEERIAEARNTIAGIVNQANALEQAARSAVTAVESSADATDEQIADVRFHGNAALDALRDIVRASGVANAATTGAQAEGAVASANAALGRLNVARTEAVGIQNRVEAAANLREQQAAEEQLATNGSSLIQHVRDNKLVFDAVIADLKNTGTDPLTVGPATSGTGQATYPATTGDASNVRPGSRGVTVTPTGGSALSSDSTTSPLGGTGSLPHGFDLKSGTTFVNAYTDINITNPRASTGLEEDGNADNGDERYASKADADYLLAGIWLQNNAIVAFAYGGQPLSANRPGDNSPFDECNPYERTTITNTTCTSLTTGFGTITSIVPAGEQQTATYRGDANGAYLASGAMSYFEADVELTAVFRNAVAGTTGGSGNISGEITNIVAAGKSIDGSIELRETTLNDDISGIFPTATTSSLAVGVVAGESYRGGWRGQFFGQRISGAKRDTTTTPGTTLITFSPLAPGSVAGTFNVIKESGDGDAAFIGSFGAHR